MALTDELSKRTTINIQEKADRVIVETIYDAMQKEKTKLSKQVKIRMSICLLRIYFQRY